ncbi:kinase-like protein [Calocera viscosa TUFC12733]|uniref:Kinase-like protein n=1 Tax=Calocera viscosa (strain TUFC12733) TaxID=1330018 RepID=A0A167FKN7_CALVF|nr:kinase-like protein [Calocera viscosa TUFC12733]
MRLVRRYTTIPIPRPICIIAFRRKEYILMTRISGVSLLSVWTSLSEDLRKHAIQQVAACMAQLRYIPNRYGATICSATGGRFNDERLALFETCEPFPDEKALLKRLSFPTPEVLDLAEPSYPAYVRRVVFSQPTSPQLCHGDLNPDNIFVDPRTCELKYIMDWEQAGFFPPWWEGVKTDMVFWSRRWLRDSLEPYLHLLPGGEYTDHIQACNYMARRFGAPM